MAHPNEARFREGYAAFQRGDVESLGAEYFAQDIVWHTPGSNRFSGDQKGVQAVLEQFGQLVQETGGNFTVELHDVLANDEHGVALVTVRGKRDNKTLEDRYVHIVHLRDGKVTESWIFQEHQDRVDQFWG